MFYQIFTDWTLNIRMVRDSNLDNENSYLRKLKFLFRSTFNKIQALRVFNFPPIDLRRALSYFHWREKENTPVGGKLSGHEMWRVEISPPRTDTYGATGGSRREVFQANQDLDVQLRPIRRPKGWIRKEKTKQKQQMLSRAKKLFLPPCKWRFNFFFYAIRDMKITRLKPFGINAELKKFLKPRSKQKRPRQSWLGVEDCLLLMVTRKQKSGRLS